ncbi:prefoldin subunit alpha [Candidatus Parvarchaeota archaeon]|jgi:prefoldin alpha subunit|nr:MAG: prefoldin subunit alpha [Candidatus Parvarchaeota archaeon]HIG51924.1 prefoldin subunit alpha [Candidatus Pacearchaeota archaeon]
MEQELMGKLNLAYQKSQEFDKQINIISQQTLELSKFGEHLDELISFEEKKILTSLGKGVFIKSSIDEKKLFVEVGTGIFIKKDPENARKVVDSQIKKLEELKNSLMLEASQNDEALKEMMKEIENKKQ